MADRDPNVPQSDDPELQADVVRLLHIVGPLGRFNVADFIMPVVNMGDVVARTVMVTQPSFRSSDVFTNGSVIAPAINTVLADTGALTDGIYDIIMRLSTNSDGNFNATWEIQHRDAANAANLAIWKEIVRSGTGGNSFAHEFAFAYEFAQNERLRVINTIAGEAARTWSAVFFARRRT